MSNENENTTENADLFPLDESAISILADIKAQMQILEAQWKGAFVLFLRQHGLKGNWQVHENGRELVRVQPVQQPAVTEPM